MRVRAFRGWRAGLSALAVVAAMVPRATLGIGIEDVVDGGNTYNWQRVELPGTVCSNGSQYRFWYYDSPSSNNLLISFEGGGACWDYPSCSGADRHPGRRESERHPDGLHHPDEGDVRVAAGERQRPGHPAVPEQDRPRDRRLRRRLHAVLHG
jgi:hypothetical protein